MDVKLPVLGPTSGYAQKLVDGGCQVHSSVALVDLAVCVLKKGEVIFSETRVNTG